MIALLTITSHVSLIWHHAVPDFDTDTIIGQADTVCDQPWIVKGMGDSAHPLGNALLQRWTCQFHQSEVLTPAQGWFILLSVGVAVIAALLIICAHFTGGGPVAATIALAYVGASPALRTLSSRAEEDWIGLALFLVTTLCILAFHRTQTRSRAWLGAVAATTLVLGVWHSQYLLVLALGLIPWGALALIRPSIVGTTRARALLLGAAMALPTGLAFGALFGSGYAVRVAYHKLFFSIFNPDYWDGTLVWCRNYVAYSSRWLTGWLGNDGMEEKLFAAPEGVPVVGLGLLALSLFGYLVVATRDSLLIAIAFGCLALPFLFEPHNAERWVPTTAIVALTLAYGAFRRPRRAQDCGRGQDGTAPAHPDPATSDEVGQDA